MQPPMVPTVPLGFGAGGDFVMLELVGDLLVVAVTGGTILAGISLGTRYLDDRLEYEEAKIAIDQPIVLPPRTNHQIEWRASDKP